MLEALETFARKLATDDVFRLRAVSNQEWALSTSGLSSGPARAGGQALLTSLSDLKKDGQTAEIVHTNGWWI